MHQYDENVQLLRLVTKKQDINNGMKRQICLNNPTQDHFCKTKTKNADHEINSEWTDHIFTSLT